jgi:hypothetical protein
MAPRLMTYDLTSPRTEAEENPGAGLLLVGLSLMGLLGGGVAYYVYSSQASAAAAKEERKAKRQEAKNKKKGGGETSGEPSQEEIDKAVEAVQKQAASDVGASVSSLQVKGINPNDDGTLFVTVSFMGMDQDYFWDGSTARKQTS